MFTFHNDCRNVASLFDCPTFYIVVLLFRKFNMMLKVTINLGLLEMNFYSQLFQICYNSGLTVDGGWTNWGNWSTCECDHSDGTGKLNRTRNCTNPAPACYGRYN